MIHEHEEFLESILRHTEHSPYLDLQNDLGQVREGGNLGVPEGPGVLGPPPSLHRVGWGWVGS